MSGFTDQQKRELATMMAEAFRLAPQPRPAAAPAPASSRVYTAEPRKYEGGKDFIDFRCEISLYITSHATDFATDPSKIFFILSYLKGGRATTWVQNYVDAATTNSVITFTDMYDQFVIKLTDSFDDPTRKEKAMAEFRNLVQGNRTADDFFNEFEILRTNAGYVDPKHDEHLIDRLKRALNFNVAE